MNDRLRSQLIAALERHLAGKPPCIPEAGRLAWSWFSDLCRTRTWHMAGPNPISHAEIEAYARLYRWPLEPRHIELIMALDRIWLDHVQMQRDGATSKMPRSSGQAITATAFDAVFS